jgi:serine/threonine protein kinase
MRISEIPHVGHGRIAVCACQATFRIDDSTVVEEFSLPDLPPPESIGRYSIVRYLGRGALNCVYEGIHPELRIPVAVKTLLPEYAADMPSRDQFLHAAKICAKVDHPNVVKVYETGRDGNGIPFLAMEFLSGGSLADRMQDHSCLSAKETAEIGAQICRALAATAKLGIVHRDIKPDNIMLSADGKYKLTDLGLAKADAAATHGNGACVLDENAPVKTARKTSFGTLEYMSPEQYIDTESCDIRSDIYSLGVTMYQLAAGRLPFETQTRSELRHMHISVEPLVPSTYVHGIPIDFDYIVMHCIQKRPDDRYHTPEELLADLEAFLKDAPLPSTTCGAVPFVRTALSDNRPVEKTGHPHSAFLHVAAGVLVLLILAGAGLLFLLERSKAAQRLKQPPPTESVPEAVPVMAPGQEEATIPSSRPSTKALDAEISIEGDESSMKASAFFEDAKTAAAQALKDGFGFQRAIDDLESFTASEDYSLEALGLISELKKASDSAVGTLMASLNEKADRLIRAGNFNGAINVYNTDIGELAPESKTAREKKIREIEQMLRDAESIPADSGSEAQEENRP